MKSLAIARLGIGDIVPHFFHKALLFTLDGSIPVLVFVWKRNDEVEDFEGNYYNIFINLLHLLYFALLLQEPAVRFVWSYVDEEKN